MGRCRALNRRWSCLSQVDLAWQMYFRTTLSLIRMQNSQMGVMQRWMCETVYLSDGRTDREIHVQGE